MKKIYLSILCLLALGAQVFAQADVTFKVDMNNYSGTIGTEVNVNGTWNNWCGSCNPLTDNDGDGIWETTIPIPLGEHEFKFTVDGWTDQELFNEGDAGTLTDPSGPFTNRALIVNGPLTFGTAEFNVPGGGAGSPDSSYIMFYVNMANTTPGDTAYIAGGASWGTPGDYPLVDPDTNGVYTGIFKRAIGFSSHYTFLNDFCPDYSCKENISGQPCADPNNFNDRLPNTPLANDTIINTCYGECSEDGTCTPLATPTQVIFQVDMNVYMQTDNDTFDYVNVSGNFNSWCGDCAQMTDPDGDGIYTDTLELQVGTYEYKYSIDNWAADETLDPTTDDSTCTMTTGGFTNRIISVGTTDTILDVTCFAECSECESVGIETISHESMKIYPNPAQGMIYVELSEIESANADVEVIDAFGRVIQQQTIVTNKVNGVNVSSLANGIYFIRLNDNGKAVTKRFMVLR